MPRSSATSPASSGPEATESSASNHGSKPRPRGAPPSSRSVGPPDESKPASGAGANRRRSVGRRYQVGLPTYRGAGQPPAGPSWWQWTIRARLVMTDDRDRPHGQAGLLAGPSDELGDGPLDVDRVVSGDRCAPDPAAAHLSTQSSRCSQTNCATWSPSARCTRAARCNRLSAAAPGLGGLAGMT